MSSTDEVAPLTEELAATLKELRDQLQRRNERPRRLRDLLQFTEQYTIPAVISLLETNIRLLELTAGAIRLAEGRMEERDGPGRGEAAVDTLERALDDLGGALRGEPTDPEARELLEEARDLRQEIRTRLATSAGESERGSSSADSGTGDDSYTVPVESASADGADGVDVDSELETIRREVHGDDDRSGEN